MNWLRQLFSRRRLYRDLSEEIQAHLDEKVEELVADGMPRDEAIAVRAAGVWQCGVNRREQPRSMDVAIRGGDFLRHPLRAARAAPQSGLYYGRFVDDRDWNRRERGGLQRCEQRAAEAAELSEGRGIGGAASDSLRAQKDWRILRMVCFSRPRCISHTPSTTGHFNR